MVGPPQEKSRERHLVERREGRAVVRVGVVRRGRRARGSPAADRVAHDLEARRRFPAAIVGQDGAVFREHDVPVAEHVARLDPRAAIAIGEYPSHGDRIAVPHDDHRAGRTIVVQDGIDRAVRGERDGKQQCEHDGPGGWTVGSATGTRAELCGLTKPTVRSGRAIAPRRRATQRMFSARRTGRAFPAGRLALNRSAS